MADLKQLAKNLANKLGDLDAPGAQRVIQYAFLASQMPEVQALADGIAEETLKDIPNKAFVDQQLPIIRAEAVKDLSLAMANGEVTEDFSSLSALEEYVSSLG